MTLDSYDTESLGQASPKALDAENEKVRTAINVLKAESNANKPSMEAELLDAAAEFLQKEVL